MLLLATTPLPLAPKCLITNPGGSMFREMHRFLSSSPSVDFFLSASLELGGLTVDLTDGRKSVISGWFEQRALTLAIFLALRRPPMLKSDDQDYSTLR